MCLLITTANRTDRRCPAINFLSRFRYIASCFHPQSNWVSDRGNLMFLLNQRTCTCPCFLRYNLRLLFAYTKIRNHFFSVGPKIFKNRIFSFCDRPVLIYQQVSFRLAHVFQKTKLNTPVKVSSKSDESLLCENITNKPISPLYNNSRI